MHNLIQFLLENWGLSGLLLLIIISLIIFELQNKAGGASLSAQELTLKMHREDLILIDVRKKIAFDKGHIVGSLNYELDSLKKSIVALKKHSAKPIVLICENAMDSKKALDILKKEEFANLSILSGGLQSWRNASMPLVTAAAQKKTTKKAKTDKKSTKKQNNK